MKKRGPFAVFLFPSFGRFSTMRSNGLFAPYRRAGVGAKQRAKKKPVFGKKKFHGIRRFHGTLCLYGYSDTMWPLARMTDGRFIFRIFEPLK